MARTKSKRYIQFVEYLISGGAYFWSGYAFYWFADQQLHWKFWVTKLSASVVGWIVNFALQRFWVFANPSLRGHLTEVTRRYMIITLVDFGLDLAIVGGLKAVGLSPYLGQFASAGFFTGWNYLWYRYWVFPDKLKKRPLAQHGTVRLIAHRPHGHSAYRRMSNGR